MYIIYVLWLRQIKKYVRSKSRIIGSLGQPLLYLVSLGFGFGSIYRRAGGGNYIEFLAPGIIAMSILFTAMFNGIDLLWDRQFGFLKETLVAPVPRLLIIFGRTLGGATVATFQGLIVLILSLFVGFKPVTPMLLPITLIFMFLIALFFTALGTMIASMLDDMHGFQMIMSFLIMPIFFLSGALFPLQGLPAAMEVLTKIDPLTYGIDGLRATLINVGSFGIMLDLFILTVLTTIVLGISSYLFKKIQV